MLRYLTLLLLAGCAAAPQDACTRECNPVFDSCMDAGSRLISSHAIEMLEGQCGAAQESCIRACKQDSYQ
jgi:hypothetical protein